MRAEKQEDRLDSTLLALLEHEQRLARWQSLPQTARQEAVDQLARMLLRALLREGGDEVGNAGAAAAP